MRNIIAWLPRFVCSPSGEADENRKITGGYIQDLDNWENKRVQRLEGEHDGIL